VFCPNCGAQNDDTAMVCTKCGHQLRAAAAPKFKGTMLMMNNPGIPRPGAAGPGPGAPGPMGAPPGAPPAGPFGAPPGAGPGGPPGAVQPKPKLKGTMIGVAPPSLGSNAPAGAAMPPSVGPTPGMGQPGMGQPGMGQPGMGQPGMAPAPAPEPQAPPQHDVNPLGGTMVADPGALAGIPGMPPPGFGPPPGADPNAGPPPGPGFGTPPPGFAPNAPPPPQQGFGIDQTLQQGQVPMPGGSQPLDAGGGALAAPAGPPQGMSLEDIPKGMVGGPNPVVTVLLIVFTCGIYGVYLLIKNKKGG
jgi:hypothetical protein